MAHVITHSPARCATCSEWALHYVQAVFNRDASITAAIKERDDTISAPYQKDASSLRHELDTLQDNIALLRKDCEDTKDRLSYAKDDLADLQHAKEESERRLNLTIDELQAQIKLLQSDALERDTSPRPPRKTPRYDSRSPSRHHPQQPLARSSRPDSPMVEDRDDITSHRRAVPQLLERLAINPTAASSTSSLQDIPPSSAEPSPSVGGDFASRISDAPTIESSAHTLTPAAPLYAATTYYESLGFPALLPVLCYSHNHYSMTLRAAAMHPNNSFNPAPFVTHTHYIYAVGENTNQHPNWVTTLFPIGHLMLRSSGLKVRHAQKVFATSQMVEVFGVSKD